MPLPNAFELTSFDSASALGIAAAPDRERVAGRRCAGQRDAHAVERARGVPDIVIVAPAAGSYGTVSVGLLIVTDVGGVVPIVTVVPTGKPVSVFAVAS